MSHKNISTEDFFVNACPECNGTGSSYADKKNYFCPIVCPVCGGTGKAGANSSKIGKAILIAVMLLAIGFGICKLLNL